MNLITLTLVQSGGEISGHYTCEFGNYLCRHDGMDDAGYIAAGSVVGRNLRLRIMIPADVSSCMFYGAISAERMTGGYTCYEGGGLVEEGIWQAVRIY